MKAFVFFAMLAFLGGSQAGLLDDLSAALTGAFDNIITEAQTAAQSLLDTYVPVLGQAAQQLVGEAVSSAGQALTDLVTGKKRRQTVTEIGGIIHDGIQQILEHTTTAIQNVQQAVQAGLTGLFAGTDPAPATRMIGLAGGKGKAKIMKQKKVIMTKLQSAVAKMARTRGILDDFANAVGTIFQPAVDAAGQAIGQFVDVASAVGQQVADHAATLWTNVSGTFAQIGDQVYQVALPYIQDAQTIVASINNGFTETFGAGVGA